MDLSLIYPCLRIMLGDLDASVRRYPDDSLQTGVKTALLLNKLPGFALTVDGGSLAPEPSPDQFALLLYHTCKLFHGPAAGPVCVSDAGVQREHRLGAPVSPDD